MMSELSDEQKSVMLAKAIGWKVIGECYILPPVEYYDTDGSEHITKDLYSPEHMSLAWRVLNWAAESLDSDVPHPVSRFVERSGFEAIPPAKAQRMWLDMVLGLAIEAGLVGTEREKVK